MMCFYHPTTTVAIDDDNDFLRAITLHIGLKDCVSFTSPKTAIQSLNKRKLFERIYARIAKKPQILADIDTPEDYALQINIHKLHEEIYSHDRFHDTSVLITDYHMDEMSGIEVCEALSNHPSKKILLTGSADKEKVAIAAFNKGIIHRYINKSDPDFPLQLQQAIASLKEAYFREMTARLMPLISTENNSLLQNSAYVNFTRNLQDQFNAVEHYLLDKIGSRVSFDANSNPLWLVIKHETEIDNYINIANDQDADDALINSLTQRKMIPFFFTADDFQKPVDEWGNYLYDAHPLAGANGYYYAIIQGAIRNNLDHEKMVSYGKFLEIEPTPNLIHI